jgi:hypothetical protein
MLIVCGFDFKNSGRLLKMGNPERVDKNYDESPKGKDDLIGCIIAHSLGHVNLVHKCSLVISLFIARDLILYVLYLISYVCILSVISFVWLNFRRL